MNRMPCSITTGRQFDDGDIEVTIPEPLDLFYMLPNGLADELVSDAVDEPHKLSNRTYLAQMFKLDSEYGRIGDYLALGDELHKLMDEVRTRIGESEYAQRWWLRNVGHEHDY